MRIMVMALLAVSAQAFGADDLLSLYREAMANNAAFQAVRYGVEAERLEEEKAKARLLPTISLSAAGYQSQSDRTMPNFLGASRTERFRYGNYNYNLVLRQPLFNLELTASLEQAHAIGDAAQATFDKARQELAVKVVAAYCDVLGALDQHAQVLAQRKALEVQLDSVKKGFQAGWGTLTDVDDVQSRLDMSLAQEIEVGHQVENARQALSALVGRDLHEIHNLDPGRIEFESLDSKYWQEVIEKARNRNPEVEVLHNQMLAAKQEESKVGAAHLPTVELVALTNASTNDNVTTLSRSGNTQYQTNSIGIQLNVPIFNGGHVNASMIQAQAKTEQSRQKYLESARNLEVEIHKEYSSMRQSIEKIKALEQALSSAERLKYSTQKGIRAGTRTYVDTLLAEQHFSATKRDLSEARYKYIVSRMRLSALAGDLSEDELSRINRWFATPQVIDAMYLSH